MKICIVGSGQMTPAMVDYFLQRNYEIIMLNIDLKMAEDVLRGRMGTKSVFWKITNQELDESVLDECVRQSNIVISMVPSRIHPIVARSCIRMKKNMLTCSYITPEIQSLHEEAKKAGIFILNELGESPGLDHFATVKVLEEVASKPLSQVKEVNSFCSGIPAHESNNNPFFYKINWSPATLLLSSQTTANYLKEGKIVVVEGKTLFENYFLKDVPKIGVFECYPNKKIDNYIPAFGLKPKNLTFFRGLLRHPGYCTNMRLLIKLGLFDFNKKGKFGGSRYRDFLCDFLGEQRSEDLNVLKEYVCKKLEIKDLRNDIIHRLEWIGLFSEQIIPKTKEMMSCADVCVTLFENKLMYREGEKDMVICHVEVIEEEGGKCFKHSASLKVIGEAKDSKNGYSAMCRAVGFCAAIVARIVLEEPEVVNAREKRGTLIAPEWKELAGPVLLEFESLGFKFEKNVNQIFL